ncbi:hypothetical protein X750_18510 [Mesorhizobium sp. LNJC394B00]|nr:hypothetical protein X750_18510 [Mesorhizobium sp. LNJC394B00]
MLRIPLMLWRLLAMVGLAYVVVQAVVDHKPAHAPDNRSPSSSGSISDDDADEAYREYHDDLSYRYR